MEQLCGGGHVSPPSTVPMLADAFSDDFSDVELAQLLTGDDEESPATQPS